MSLFLIVFVVFVFHIQFLCQLLWTGESSFNFFGWKSEYLYSQHIAQQTLFFSLMCLITLVCGYFLKRKKIRIEDRLKSSVEINVSKYVPALNVLLIIQIFITLFVILKGHGNYHAMVSTRENMNFFFELRIFPILLFVFVFCGIPVKEWSNRIYRKSLYLFCIMFFLFVIVQARSLVFEMGCVLGYYYLRKTNNKLKLKYILFLYLISIIPNILVLGRLSSEQVDLSNSDTWRNIFTYEYSLLFNNILSESIVTTKDFLYGKTIFSSIGLLFPSFVREFLGISIDKTFISDVAQDAGVFGGSFSLLAEMYLNFGWGAIMAFGVLGYFLGYIDNLFFNYKQISLKASAVPLAYSYLVLAFRNDFAVCLKQLIQLLIIIYLIEFISRIKIKSTI